MKERQNGHGCTDAIARLVDRAIADAVRGLRVGMAVEDLVVAASADTALLQAAADAAGRLAERSPSAELDLAVVHLRAAHRYLAETAAVVAG
jgi:hypothetical protein